MCDTLHPELWHVLLLMENPFHYYTIASFHENSLETSPVCSRLQPTHFITLTIQTHQMAHTTVSWFKGIHIDWYMWGFISFYSDFSTGKQWLLLKLCFTSVPLIICLHSGLLLWLLKRGVTVIADHNHKRFSFKPFIKNVLGNRKI